MLLLILLTVPTLTSAGQTVPAPTAKDAAIESHFAAAQRAQHDNDYATAEREYHAVLALVPDFAEVHMNLGLVFQLQDRSAEAMTEFRRALKIKPALAGANFFLGIDYCKLGEGTRAIPYLKVGAATQGGRSSLSFGKGLRAVGETRSRAPDENCSGLCAQRTATGGELCVEHRVAFRGDSFSECPGCFSGRCWIAR